MVINGMQVNRDGSRFGGGGGEQMLGLSAGRKPKCRGGYTQYIPILRYGGGGSCRISQRYGYSSKSLECPLFFCPKPLNNLVSLHVS